MLFLFFLLCLLKIVNSKKLISADNKAAVVKDILTQLHLVRDGCREAEEVTMARGRGEGWEFGEGVTTMECALQSEDAATTCRHPGCSDMKTCGSEMGYNSYDQAKSKDTWLQ